MNNNFETNTIKIKNGKKVSKKFQKKQKLKQDFRERRQQIYNLIREVGLWNLDKKILAEHFGVSLKTIYRDINIIIKNIDPEELNAVRFILDADFKKAESELRNILRNPKTNTAQKLRAIELLMQFAERYTKFLEAYGLKEKIAEKLQIETRTTFKTLEEIYNEIYGNGDNTP